MTSQIIALRLQHAAQRLADRLAQLEEQLQRDETAAWAEFREVAVALASILPTLAPGRSGELLTTKQMAERLGVSAKTVLKRRKAGALRPAMVLGKRGRAALRWNGSEVPR